MNEKIELEAKKEAMERQIAEAYQELDKLSERSSISTLVLAIFPPGVHRMLSGKMLSGLLYMFTGGWLLIWMLADLFVIGSGKFRDKDGKCINTPKRKGYETEIILLSSKIEEIERQLAKYK